MSVFSLLLISGTAYCAPEIPVEDESSVFNTGYEDYLVEDEFRNDQGVLVTDEQIKLLKGQYISSYNYSQDPISYKMGYSTRTNSPNGTYHGGLTFLLGQNRPEFSPNVTSNVNIANVWGQTGRFGGFALGGAISGTSSFNDSGHTDTFNSASQYTLSQAYLNYQYSNKVDAYIGNIILSTPWVNSVGSHGGVVYGMGVNPYQGALVNVQPLPSVFLTGFTAWGYMPYPDNWVSPRTFFNITNSLLRNNIPTSGTSGVGLRWNPVDSYSGQLWLYNFADYANLAYVDNSYHVDVSKLFSMDFGLQAHSEVSSGSSITNQVLAPNQTTTLGNVSSNGLGARVGFNLGSNATSISFNNVFGSNGSYLNGGTVSPYTYSEQIDPLYTTVAIYSLAELGSGYGYTIRNTTSFMDNVFRFQLAIAQFYVNQAYVQQVPQVTVYNANIIYRVPHTDLNIWGRLYYTQKPDDYGGGMLQPRIIVNWTF